MKAMTYRGPYRVRLDDKPVPQVEHPEDAIIRVTRAAVCGSDLHLYHGLVPDTRVGTTFGHEFTGIVEEVGPNVTALKRGDRVLVPFNVFCGSCFFCKKDLFGMCHNANAQTSLGAIYGYSHTTGGFDGGQAEYVRVPFANAGPEIIPEDISEDDAAVLTDACPTGYMAAEMGEIKQGDTVVVFGAGPVGLFAAKSAWLLGAGRVITVDHLDYRLDFARKFANVETINFLEHKDIVVYIKKITDYLGADVCIDAVGAEADGSFFHTLTGVKLKMQAGAANALQWCINSVRKGGVVSIVGVYGPTGNMVPVGNVLNKGLTLRAGQCNVKRYLPRLFEHIRQGHLKPSEVITHRMPLHSVADAYNMMASKKDHMIKPFLVMDRAA
jgi:threonine dehydrogenase-like Zn-dependent dehydrogenase